MKNKGIKNLKNGEKKWPDIGIYTYYLLALHLKDYNMSQKSGKRTKTRSFIIT